MGKCEFCTNRATRNPHNPHQKKTVEVCEIHYAYIKPNSARANPIDISRCIRCGHKSLSRDGREERLIDHHVNYPLDLTVPVCDHCHSLIHNHESGDPLDGGDFAFDPVGVKIQTGTRIAAEYRHNQRQSLDKPCPECNTRLMWAITAMGMDDEYLCPNAECSLTTVEYDDTL